MPPEDEIILSSSIDPEFILWRNQGHTTAKRCLVTFRSFLIAGFLLLITYLGVSGFS